jgi:hypothetical protein
MVFENIFICYYSGCCILSSATGLMQAFVSMAIEKVSIDDKLEILCLILILSLHNMFFNWCSENITHYVVGQTSCDEIIVTHAWYWTILKIAKTHFTRFANVHGNWDCMEYSVNVACLHCKHLNMYLGYWYIYTACMHLINRNFLYRYVQYSANSYRGVLTKYYDRFSVMLSIPRNLSYLYSTKLWYYLLNCIYPKNTEHS